MLSQAGATNLDATRGTGGGFRREMNGSFHHPLPSRSGDSPHPFLPFHLLPFRSVPSSIYGTRKGNRGGGRARRERSLSLGGGGTIYSSYADERTVTGSGYLRGKAYASRKSIEIFEK